MMGVNEVQSKLRIGKVRRVEHHPRPTVVHLS